jgi:hypothetical protein
VHDARLNLRLGIDCLDGFEEAAQVVHDGDQYVVQSAVFQLVEDLQPELGAFCLLDPQSHHFLATINANAQGQIHGLVFDGAFVPDFQAQSSLSLAK